MSCAKAFLRSWSTIALPPYFTTITLPWYFISHGRAPARTVVRSCSVCIGLVFLLVDRWSVGQGSGAVGGVLVHVGVREVVGPHRGLRAPRLEVDGHGDLARAQVDEVG